MSITCSEGGATFGPTQSSTSTPRFIQSVRTVRTSMKLRMLYLQERILRLFEDLRWRFTGR